MGKYAVISGQNIYDVALHLYGSIEGIVDLMMNNTSLSLCDKLLVGQELIYTDDFIINRDIVAYNKSHNIVPANGERNVYFKESTYPLIGALILHETARGAEFSLSGTGTLEIDWGDNTPLEYFRLTILTQKISHYFDNAVAAPRKLRLYGELDLYVADFSEINILAVYLAKPLHLEICSFKNSNLSLDFLALAEDLHTLNLTGLKCASLMPLVRLESLAFLDLSNVLVDQKDLDQYLIHLVNQYYGRRSCTIILTLSPSGEYKEPVRDENNRYNIQSGMEAIWVLTHESSWNEGGFWKFMIHNTIYTEEL